MEGFAPYRPPLWGMVELLGGYIPPILLVLPMSVVGITSTTLLDQLRTPYVATLFQIENLHVN